MSIPIEGYTVVVKKERIEDLLEQGTIVPPNGMHFADDHIWRCSFMAEADAQHFLESLSAVGLNVAQGPDSDGVIVNEFNREIHPYCEWLQTATWEKAVLAWKIGSDPKKLIAHENFDPKVGSGLSFHDHGSMDDLEFVRMDGNVEVYFNKKLGKEVYIGRTTPSTEARFKTACETIRKNFRTAGEPTLTGPAEKEVTEAMATLDDLLEQDPEWWQVLFFHGKGSIAIGKYDQAFDSFKRAYEIEPNVEAIPRELAGLCLEAGHFEQAVQIGEKAAALKPDDAGTLGNLAVSYLLAGNLSAARKSIDAANQIDTNDEINKSISAVIHGVENGKLNQPGSMNELNRAANELIKQSKPNRSKPKRPFWKFWQK